MGTTHMIASPGGRYVVLHIRPGPPYPDPSTPPQIAADARFNLSDNIWIERLDTEFAKLIQRACEPPNHNVYNDVWDRHLYAFVREVPEKETVRLPGTVSGDEGIIPLLKTIAFSRLVHPTSTGDRYCAHILPCAGTDVMIQALQLRGVCPDVFPGDVSRDWLSSEDGIELRRLMPWAYRPKWVPERVNRAFWNHEQAMRTYYLDMRWTLIVSAFEALVNVDRKDVKAQFKRRVGKLATEFRVPLSETELDDAYAVRSKLAHGQGFLFDLHAVLPPDKHRPLYDKLETLLRAILKRCFLDDAFGRNFADEAAVNANWP